MQYFIDPLMQKCVRERYEKEQRERQGLDLAPAARQAFLAAKEDACAGAQGWDLWREGWSWVEKPVWFSEE